jgi:hypothetical protein
VIMFLKKKWFFSSHITGRSLPEENTVNFKIRVE